MGSEKSIWLRLQLLYTLQSAQWRHGVQVLWLQNKLYIVLYPVTTWMLQNIHSVSTAYTRLGYGGNRSNLETHTFLSLVTLSCSAWGILMCSQAKKDVKPLQQPGPASGSSLSGMCREKIQKKAP